MWMNVNWIPISACLGNVKTPKAPSFVTVKLGIPSRKEAQGAQVKQISSECVTYFGWLLGTTNAWVFTCKREVGICMYFNINIYVCISECFTSASTCQSFRGSVPLPASMLEAPYKLILKILSAQVLWALVLQNLAWGGKAAVALEWFYQCSFVTCTWAHLNSNCRKWPRGLRKE